MNKGLGFGLNTQGKKYILDDGSSSYDDDDGPDDRGGVRSTNQEIETDQAALRQRAERMYDASSSSGNVNDYDGQYDTFASGGKGNERKGGEESATAASAPKKSRYVSSLLRTAESRKKEQEVVRERRIARELRSEEQRVEFRGKEKFVTGAYKRKLEERERWKTQDEEREKRDVKDVVEKRDPAGFTSASLLRNVALSGERRGENTGRGGPAFSPHSEEDRQSGGRKGYSVDSVNQIISAPNSPPVIKSELPVESADGARVMHERDTNMNVLGKLMPVEDMSWKKRDKRNRKIEAARERYLQRCQKRLSEGMDLVPLDQ